MSDAFNQEEAYLKHAVDIIKNDFQNLNKDIYQIEASYQEGMKDVSQTGKEDDRIEMIKHLNKMMKERGYVFKKRTLTRLKSQLDKPYFARLDFKTAGSSFPLKLYIGKYAYLANDNNQDTGKVVITRGVVRNLRPQSNKINISNSLRILDWRSPFASLYYNYNEATKDASYSFEVIDKEKPWLYIKKEIRGDLELRRNFEIENSTLLGIHDNSLKIDLLSKALSEKTGGKLQDIVATIQELQNQIIRSDPFKVCVVQGVAGSGKTTIAIHRISYLLYAFKDLIKENNTLLLTTVKVLVNYISKSLPDLDVYNLKSETIARYFSYLLYDNGYKVNPTRVSPYKDEFSGIKNSKEFVEYLRDRITKHEKEVITKILKLTYAEDLRLERYFSRKVHVYEQLKEVIDDLNEDYEYLLKEHKASIASHSEKLNVLNVTLVGLNNIYKDFDLFNFYTELIHQWNKDSSKVISVSRQLLNVDDVCVLYYIVKNFYNLLPLIGKYKQIFIDEGQDLGLLQYLAVNELVDHNGLTILGDLNQATESKGTITDWEDLDIIFGKENINYFEIKISYRTTKNIIGFARKILEKFDFKNLPEPFDRDGPPVALEKFVSRKAMLDQLINQINNLRNQGVLKSIGIIETDEKGVHDTLKYLTLNGLDVKHVTSEFDNFTNTGIFLVSEKIVKGLEFDSVFIIDPNENSFPYNRESAKRLYICATRAINRLYIYHISNLNRIF